LCPSPEVLYPCECDQNGITSRINAALNLKRVFENIDQNLGENEKHLKQFYLSNDLITEIEENAFFGHFR
jgi:hypothetical protein